MVGQGGSLQNLPKGKSLAALLAHLPSGFAWLGFRSPGKLQHKIMRGFSGAYERMLDFLCYLEREADPYRTVDLIGAWEFAVGLPDPCFPTPETLEQRRAYVLFRLDKRRWVTAQDFEDLGRFFGIEIKVTPGTVAENRRGYPLCYPHPYSEIPPRGGRFRLYVDMPECDFGGYDYEYPMAYGGQAGNCEAFLCLLRRIKPANVILIINQTPEICEVEDA